MPHENLYPNGKTDAESTQENAEEFSQSQQSAKVAALKQLGVPVSARVIVSSVVKASPADGTLHAGDVVKAVDGAPVNAPEDVAKLVTKHKPGEPVEFTIIPAAEAAEAVKANREPASTPPRSPSPRARRRATATPSSASGPGPTTPSRSRSTSSSPTSAAPARG